jgi:hypothetical protein
MDDCAKKPKKESPIDVSLGRLEKEIATIQETTAKFETLLADVLGQPEKTGDCEAPNSKGQTSLETKLTVLTERIMDINGNLRQIQNRVQF